MEPVFELIQIALGTIKSLTHRPSNEEWLNIYEISKKQAILGILLFAIDKLPKEQRPRQELLRQWIGVGEMIRRQGKAVNKGVVKLQQLMRTRGIEYVVVKGQVVASYYPEPLMRQSGDVDYYCDAENFPKAQEAIKVAWGIETDAEGSDFHVHYDYEGVTYEGHFALVRLYNKKKEAYWREILAKDSGSTTVIDGCGICTLSPTLHTLYVFLHLYSHLLKLGVGLRQFCDLAVMLLYCRSEIDLQQLQQHLAVLGMERAFRACGSILVDCLGLPEKELGYSLTDADRRYGKKILGVVMYRGNMGHYNKRGGFRGWKHKVEAAGIKLSHFAKFWRLAPRYSWGWLRHEVKRNF